MQRKSIFNWNSFPENIYFVSIIVKYFFKQKSPDGLSR